MSDEQQTTTQPEDTLEAAQQRANDFEAKWKRALADYQNREKDIARERLEFAQFCAADVVRDFLSIVDAIAAANVHPPTPSLPEGGGENKNFSPSHREGERLVPTRASGEGVGHVAGFVALQKLCADFLKRQDVEPVGAVGEPVDYLLHEVVGTKAEVKKIPGIILEVAQIGYTMHGRLLRPAKVIMSTEGK